MRKEAIGFWHPYSTRATRGRVEVLPEENVAAPSGDPTGTLPEVPFSEFRGEGGEESLI